MTQDIALEAHVLNVMMDIIIKNLTATNAQITASLALEAASARNVFLEDTVQYANFTVL